VVAQLKLFLFERDRLERLNFGQKLEGLYTMFPQTSKLKVKTILKTSRFNVKEAIECLLKDATNDDLSVSSFTDFDEEENSKDSKISTKSTSTASSTNSKKRSLEFDDENKGTFRYYHFFIDCLWDSL
jgi:hypothetical protein